MAHLDHLMVMDHSTSTETQLLLMLKIHQLMGLDLMEKDVSILIDNNYTNHFYILYLFYCSSIILIIIIIKQKIERNKKKQHNLVTQRHKNI